MDLNVLGLRWAETEVSISYMNYLLGYIKMVSVFQRKW